MTASGTEIEYQDGSRKVVGTDGGWKVFDGGPIRQAELLGKLQR